MAPENEVTRPVIAVLTDFGSIDPYAAIMKGVILSKAPEARIIDITHAVSAQSINEAAFLLEISRAYFPEGTVFLVVVDPGVGSSRGRLAIEVGGKTFVGPDNGCLSAALNDSQRGQRGRGEGYTLRAVTLDATPNAVRIENQARFLTPVSATFEGRDVFAPAAAYLAAGGRLADLGPPVHEMQALPAFRAPRDGGKLDGRVVHIDIYGNLITDIRAADASLGAGFLVHGEEVPFVRTYADAAGGQLVAVAGSSGFIEIAIPSGNAARRLTAVIGDSVEQ